MNLQRPNKTARSLLAGFLGVCVVAFGSAACFSQSESKADLIVINSKVRACDKDMQEFEAFAVSNGRYVAVGSTQDIQAWQGPETVVEDGTRWTITPGLTDSHLHFLGLGESLQNLDLRLCTSWAEIVERVKQAASLQPPGTWIVGRGWHQSKWTEAPEESLDGYPAHTAMSLAVPEHPVALTHASGHALFANALAMKKAGVTSSTSDPNGGEILRNTLGEPIGIFRENAQSLIRRSQMRTTNRLTPEQRREQMVEQVRLAANECLRHGVTSVHDAGSGFATATSMQQLAEQGQLPLRVTMMIRTSVDELEAKMSSHRWVGIGDGFFTVRSVKLSIDGALGPHGAWLLQPYADLPQKLGLNTVALDDLKTVAELCKKHQWQLCVHAIGDRANREVLDVYEQVLGAEVSGDHRWRIEHAQHLSPSDISRFGELGVIPAMQANHCTSDATFVPTRLGERRSAEGAYVWRSLIDQGAIVPNGTDAPVEPVDPRASLYASVSRQLKDGSQFYPEQCMTREESLLSYTLWPAMASFQEQDTGSIEVGKRADFVAWDIDLLSCEPQKILDAQVQKVWLGGHEVQLQTD